MCGSSPLAPRFLADASVPVRLPVRTTPPRSRRIADDRGPWGTTLQTTTTPLWEQSLDQFEDALEHEMAMERRRRQQLRQRTAARSRARSIEKTEQRGKVRFSVLFVALTATVVTVVVIMFETLALLMG
jgi:hypothetical protein